MYKIIIHHDEVKFIPGIQGSFNIQISINEIHEISKLKKNIMLSYELVEKRHLIYPTHIHDKIVSVN